MIEYKMMNAFFDSQKIQAALDKETRKSMVKSLAAVRRQMRSQLRRRKRASRPGESPSVHSRNPLASLKAVFFAFDMATKSGVVGSIKLPNSEAESPLPGLMEFGGTVQLKTKRRRGVKRRKTSGNRRIQKVRIEPRPTAGPSLQIEANAGNILSPWANVVGG